MKVTELEKWKELFGVGWANIMSLCPEIGGYLIDHKNRKVYLDANARKLAEIDEQPTYEAMNDFISLLSADTSTFARLLPKPFYQNDEYTAGILRWHYDFSGAQAKSVVPMVEKPNLAAMISNCKTNSLLALLEFSMSDRSYLEEYHLFGVLASVINSLPNGAILCADHKNAFWVFVPDFEGDPVKCLTDVQKNVRESGQGRRPGQTGADERYIVFTAGVGISDGKADRRMGTAEFALYEANISGTGSILLYSYEQYETNRAEYEKMRRFYRLINENLFIYHFQPIVSAKNGEVVAYEMLMRTDSSIGMNPLEILDCAEKAGRLYEIEKATMKNALDIIERHQDIFRSRKLFVNSITAYTLADDDWATLEQRYGELMEKMVIEFTEGTELDDKGIDKIRQRFLRLNIKTAIDDFGTGYSNTSNLIKYSPNYVKIDRSLISGIDRKPSIRKLVSGFIEFIHESGYYALAEGVETYEELQTMIQLGSDLIQGFYVSKPRPIMLFEVSDNIAQDIERINLISSANIAKPYYPENGEEVDLTTVKSGGYNSIFIECPNVTLHGRCDLDLDLVISVKNGVNSNITLKNVRLKTERDTPIFAIGDNCEIELIVTGENDFDGCGIQVPHSSKLHVTGSGVLNVVSNSEDCYGIGVGMGSSPGVIVIEMDGQLNVHANGDTAVGIGGGYNEYDIPIRLISGSVNVVCSGRSCLGIGIYEGNSIVDIEDCACSIEITAPNIVGIGSFGKKTSLNLKKFSLTETLCGIRATGIGSVEEGIGSVIVSHGVIDMTIKARIVSCIGTLGGNMECRVKNSSVKLYCESGSVSGIGDTHGSGDVYLEDSDFDFDFRTGDGIAFGSKTGILKCSGLTENIRINE